MDVIQALCYRVVQLLYSLLGILGLVRVQPLYSVDSSSYAKEGEAESELPIFRGTYRQVNPSTFEQIPDSLHRSLTS